MAMFATMSAVAAKPSLTLAAPKAAAAASSPFLAGQRVPVRASAPRKAQAVVAFTPKVVASGCYPRSSRMGPGFRSAMWNSETVERMVRQWEKAISEECNIGFGAAVDIIEAKDSYRIVLDVPGVSKEDIKVMVVENRLEVSGERPKLEKGEDETLKRSERITGKFVRSFAFPRDADASMVSASVLNGVLTVTVGKKETSRPVEVPIE